MTDSAGGPGKAERALQNDPEVMRSPVVLRPPFLEVIFLTSKMEVHKKWTININHPSFEKHCKIHILAKPYVNLIICKLALSPQLLKPSALNFQISDLRSQIPAPRSHHPHPHCCMYLIYICTYIYQCIAVCILYVSYIYYMYLIYTIYISVYCCMYLIYICISVLLYISCMYI